MRWRSCGSDSHHISAASGQWCEGEKAAAVGFSGADAGEERPAGQVRVGDAEGAVERRGVQDDPVSLGGGGVAVLGEDQPVARGQLDLRYWAVCAVGGWERGETPAVETAGEPVELVGRGAVCDAYVTGPGGGQVFFLAGGGTRGVAGRGDRVGPESEAELAACLDAVE